MSDARTPPIPVRIRGLRKRFDGKRRGRQWLRPWQRPAPIVALDGVDLDVEEGKLVTLLGPNGAGKTTLLKVLATLVVPTEGQVELLGRDVVAAPRAAKRAVGYVLADDRSFYWRLSCRQNLAFFAALHGLDRRRAADRIRELSGLVGLDDQLDRTFADLSAGQRQRVAIARGLLADPPVLLFDEATRSLDPGRAKRIRRIIREILVDRVQKAVVFATHDLQEARELSDRVVLLKDGVVAAEGGFEACRGAIDEAFDAEAKKEDEAYARLFSEAG